jgi:hypothetical protein
VTFATNDVFKPLKVNMELPAGTTIKCKVGAATYLQVNGLTSTIKITESSMVELTRMDFHGTGLSADTDTLLTVKYGTILSSVRKLSANSRYEVVTPKGKTAVRGTDFQVTVTALADGKDPVTYVVTYTCVVGQILVSADVDGKEAMKVLTSGQEWVPGEGDVKNAPPLTPVVVVMPPAPPEPASPPPPVQLQQPFDGNGAPNPAVDAGKNPFQRINPVPMPNPLPPPPPGPGTGGVVLTPSISPPTRH